jgi:hypothetical protein
MPSWSDDAGEYWWQPPGKTWLQRVQIPHAPVAVRAGCKCRFCRDHRDQAKESKKPTRVKAVWRGPEYAPTHTRRSQVDSSCRDGYRMVDPAWVRRNGESVAVWFSYWDGDTEHHPGKWVTDDAPNLREAKKKAKAFVEAGTAKHGCRVYLVCYSWNITMAQRGFYEVWDYGSYQPSD